MNKSCHEYLGEASSLLIPVQRELEKWKSLRWVSSQHWAGRPDWKELLLSRELLTKLLVDGASEAGNLWLGLQTVQTLF